MFLIQTVKRLNLLQQAAKALIGYVKSVFKSARINKIIKENPCEYLETRTILKHCSVKVHTAEERTLSDQEYRVLWSQLEDDHKRKENYVPPYSIQLAMLTGMRTGELAGLKWNRVDRNREVIIIDASLKFNKLTKTYYMSSTKNNKIRYIPLTPEVDELLNRVRRIQMEYGYTSEFVFANENGQINTMKIARCINRFSKKAGVPMKSITAIRRTVNSRLKCMGMSTIVAASVLGHTTEVNESNYTYDVTNDKYKKDILLK